MRGLRCRDIAGTAKTSGEEPGVMTRDLHKMVVTCVTLATRTKARNTRMEPAPSRGMETRLSSGVRMVARRADGAAVRSRAMASGTLRQALSTEHGDVSGGRAYHEHESPFWNGRQFDGCSRRAERRSSHFRQRQCARSDRLKLRWRRAVGTCRLQLRRYRFAGDEFIVTGDCTGCRAGGRDYAAGRASLSIMFCRRGRWCQA